MLRRIDVGGVHVRVSDLWSAWRYDGRLYRLVGDVVEVQEPGKGWVPSAVVFVLQAQEAVPS